MTAPALLVAARRKFLASAQYDNLRAAHLIGVAQDGLTPSPWVTVGTDNNGLPNNYGEGRAAVTFYQRGSSWATADTSARFPKLGISVWAGGPVEKPDAQWLAHNVAESVIACFDDPAGEHPPTWGPDVYVIRSRWDGELTVAPVEDVPTLWRADMAFNLEVV